MVPYVSIVVPVYNVERYIEKCIVSVIKQTFKDWELLLINDGSTDNSGQICDKFAQCDTRIKVIHKINTGVSDTRNVGIEIATGKYVIFLDSDDYWCDNSPLEQLVLAAKTYDLDVVRGEYVAVSEQGDELFAREVPVDSLHYAGKVISSAEFLEYAIHGEYFLVLSLIKRQIISKIRFDKQRIFLEDVLFYSNLLLAPLRTMYLPDIRFYAYRKLANSASNMINPQKLADAFQMCYEFNKLVSQATAPSLVKIFKENSIKMYYYTLDTISLNEYYNERDNYISTNNLSQIRRDVVGWMNEYRKYYISLIYFIPPKYGVYYFRFRHYLGSIKRSIVKKMKSWSIPQ